jgi:MscS family membrane protein
MLVEHKEIDETKTLMVNFNEFAASSLDFFIYTFTHTTDWIKFHEIKQDVLFKIADIVEKHNAEMAFPTTTVHLETEQNIIKEN